MHAIVLVGGFGTRLRPLTYTVPKPMLTVGNEPIITRLVRRLEHAGVRTVTLSLGFLPDPFKEAFPGGRCGDVELRYAVEPEPLDTAGGIRFAAEVAGLDDTFLALNGDNVTDLDFADLVAAHRRFGATATLHLTSVDDVSPFGVVETDPDGRVRRFLEKPAPGVTDSRFINAGSYVMEPKVLDEIDIGAPVNIERVTFPTLAGRGELFGYGTDDYWTGTDRPELLLQANLDRLAGRYDVDMPHPVAGGRGVDASASVAEDADVVDSVIGSAVAVGARSKVRRSVLLGGSSVGKDVVVEDSIVMGSVPDGAVLSGAVIGADAAIDPGQQVTDERIPAGT